MNRARAVLFVLMLVLTLVSLPVSNSAQIKLKTGNVIFVHPDGCGIADWAIYRLLEKGPDGNINWDQMPHIGIYREHLRNSIVTSSNAGATVHAFGVKADYRDYGIHPDHPIKSSSGKDYSIMIEAQKAGKSIALINSGHLAEPGTGVFVANAKKRQMYDSITKKMIDSQAEIIMGGGEIYMLPKGEIGHHGAPGVRTDGLNLIEYAKSLDYQVVFTRDEMFALPITTEKVLGIFAPRHTFNDESEETLKEEGLPLYNPTAPTVAEMIDFSLKILQQKRNDFFMVVEEEGSDNFSNSNNAQGFIEAIRRTDNGIGIVQDFIKDNPNTLLIVGSDSNAGGPHIVKVLDKEDYQKPLPERMKNGAPLDGRDGTGSLPFLAAPDQFGNRLAFGVSWAGFTDLGGGVVARAQGLNAELLPVNVDNTDIYWLMYVTLFGVKLPR